MSILKESPRDLLQKVLLSKGRVEALTDGIFAIAMTLMVLELKVPDVPKSVSSQELLRRLGEEGPVFISFFFSFTYCGLLWFFHHLSMHFFRHMQVALVWLNLLFLMAISVLPFSCALLGHLIRNRAALEIYFGNLFLAALFLLLQWVFARKRRLINEDDPLAARAMGLRLTAFPVALAAGMLATLYQPITGFYAMTLVLLAFRIWHKARTRKEASASSPSQTAS